MTPTPFRREIVITSIRLSPMLTAVGVLLAVLLIAPQVAAQTTDPATAPIPTFETDNTARALVVELLFDGPLSVSVVSVDWADVPAPGHVGNPPQYGVKVFNRDGLAQEFDIWNPLWTFKRTAAGGERVAVESSAFATIAFPLAGDLVELQVFAIEFDDTTDEETTQQLITVDLKPAVASFCATHPDHEACDSFVPPNSAPMVTAGADITTAEGVQVGASAGYEDADAGDTHTATIAWGDGTPAEPATIAGGTVSGSHVYADNGTYTVVFSVTDSEGNPASDSLAITVTNAAPVVQAGSDQTVTVGSTVALKATLTDAGTLDTHTASIDWGDGSPAEPGAVTQSPFGPPGNTSGLSGTVAASHVYSTTGVFTVRVSVTDDDGGSGVDELTVAVEAAQDPGPTNRAPEALADGPYLGAVNTSIALDATGSTDPDGDTLTYTWSSENGVFDDPSSATPGFTAQAAGIYAVTLEVCDVHGACGTSTGSVVVYDPSAGFVTGGGWIDSPAGACGPAAPAGVCENDAAGRANFAFVSRYKKGANVPDGQTAFVFEAGDLNFHSGAYDWLVVSGKDRAQFKGSGSLNGIPGYQFMLTAYDSGSSGQPDGFRIKIWIGDGVVYDNRTGADDALNQANTQAISGGSIVIHAQ